MSVMNAMVDKNHELLQKMQQLETENIQIGIKLAKAQSEWDGYERTCKSLRIENEELKKDKERLHFMLSGLFYNIQIGKNRFIIREVLGSHIGVGETPRQAIDAAMESVRGGDNELLL